MFRKSKVDSYFNHLLDLGYTDMDNLPEDDLISLTSRMISESDELPKISDLDEDNHLILSLAKWMETEDETDGYKILSYLRDLVVKSYLPKIENEMRARCDEVKQEKVNDREGREYRSYIEYLRNHDRI